MGKRKKKSGRKSGGKSGSRIGFYFINIVLAIVIIAIVAVIGIYMFCNIHDVKVSGTLYYQPIEIEEYVLTGKYKNNAVYVMVDNMLRPKRNIPFIESAKVRMTSYDKIEIVLEEKQMTGFMAVEDGTFAYFNDDGDVVEVSDRALEGILPVTGIILKQAALGEKLEMDEKLCDNLTTAIKTFRKNKIEVSAALFDGAGNLGLWNNSVCINLGDCSDIDEKAKRITYILPKLKDMTGVLHLENWSTQDTDIVFEKTEG